MESAAVLSSALALPPHVLDQTAVRGLCQRLFGERRGFFARMADAYANAGIETRHSCVPIDWYAEPHGWVERTALFETHALALIAEASEKALAEAGLAASAVDQVVSVCTTGIATPSLESRLIDRLGLRADVQRTPVFGLGCAGGVAGLARAGALARAAPGEVVLLVAVELCALTFRPQEVSKANVIASALFGDGAAACLVRAGEDGAAATLGPAGEHTWPDSRDVMGWRVEEDGFGVVFSRDIPALIERDLAGVVDEFLARAGLGRGDLAGWLLHPGGTKVLAAYRAAFGLPEAAVERSRAVLRHCGNMSSVSVLAVLDRARRERAAGRHLMAALGPGFTAGMLLIDL